jgi:hypothetical protein
MEQSAMNRATETRSSCRKKLHLVSIREVNNCTCLSRRWTALTPYMRVRGDARPPPPAKDTWGSTLLARYPSAATYINGGHDKPCGSAERCANADPNRQLEDRDPRRQQSQSLFRSIYRCPLHYQVDLLFAVVTCE